MIPPFLVTKAASLVAPLVAKFSSPLIKWGTVAGVVVLLIGYTNWKTYDRMRTRCEESKIVAIAEQAHASGQQVIAQSDNAQVAAKQELQEAQHVREVIRYVDRERVKYVTTSTPCQLTPQYVYQWDAFDRLLADHQDGVSASDSGTRKPEVSRRGMGDSSAEILQAEDIEANAGLTTDDALQSKHDLRAKYELMRTKFRGLSQFEDGRYIVEKTGFERE